MVNKNNQAVAVWFEKNDLPGRKDKTWQGQNEGKQRND